MTDSLGAPRAPKEPARAHEAHITDWCYGMTGGVRIDCWCGYTVYPQRDVDHPTVAAYHTRTGKWPGGNS